MRRTAFSLITLLALALAARGSTDEFLMLVDQWSEWGEYQKIVDALPAFLDTAGESLDNLRRGELHKHLGVAYYALERVDEARVQFIRAWQANPDVSLDKGYVSEEIYVLFMSTIDAEKRKASEKTARDSLAQLKKEERKRQKKGKLAGKRRADLIAAISATALAAALAGATVYEYVSTEEEYDEFVSVAETGDLRAYEREKEDVEMGDRLTISAGAASAACAATGTFFFIRFAQRVRQGRSEEEQADTKSNGK